MVVVEEVVVDVDVGGGADAVAVSDPWLRVREGEGRPLLGTAPLLLLTLSLC